LSDGPFDKAYLGPSNIQSATVSEKDKTFKKVVSSVSEMADTVREGGSVNFSGFGAKVKVS